MPEDDMGVGHALKDPAGKSITEETFKILTQNSGKSYTQIKQSTLDQLEGKTKNKILSDLVLKNAADSQGMSIKEASEETIKLLKKELNHS
jgi:hypothetical protein